MSPEQRDFIQIVGNLIAVLFAISFIGNTIAAIINFSDRTLHIAKICAICSVVSFIIMSVALFLSFLSLG